MGSFNVTCGLTNTSIEVGEKVYFIPLIRREGGDLQDDTMVISNDMSSVYYEPFAFAIEGTYADCGIIDSIVKDKNTMAIEKYFDIEIGDLLSLIEDDYDGMAGMWLNKEIVDIVFSKFNKKGDIMGRYDELVDFIENYPESGWKSMSPLTMFLNFPSATSRGLFEKIYNDCICEESFRERFEFKLTLERIMDMTNKIIMPSLNGGDYDVEKLVLEATLGIVRGKVENE